MGKCVEFGRFRDTKYLVNEYGEVLNTDNCKYLSQFLDDNGYKQVSLNGKTFRVHCLVAEVFHGGRPPGFVVDHVDGDKLNNYKENLEYVTSDENAQRYFMKPYIITSPTGKVYTARTLRSFCKEHGLDNSAMAKVCKGIYKSHKGWEVIKHG